MTRLEPTPATRDHLLTPGVVLAATGGLVLVVVAAALLQVHRGFLDLEVYAFGARTLLDGGHLYAADDPATGLPFTYPPFAALLMAGLALLPLPVSAALWAATGVLALALVVHVVRPDLAPWAVLGVCVAALALEPVRETLTFGQVNLLLMALVVVDLLGPRRRWSGALVGLAAAVKLTPLVFVVLLLGTGRRGDAARAVVAVVGAGVVGALVAPRSSWDYWTSVLADPERPGSPAFATNQSVSGVLARALGGPAPTLLWLIVAGAVSLGVLALGCVWWRRGDPALGVGLAAVAMLLASPISWSHHWVWALPVALVLLERGPRWAAAGWAAVFVLAPFWLLPHRDDVEYAWSPAQQVVGSAYVVAGVLLAAGAALALGLARPARPPSPSADD